MLIFDAQVIKSATLASSSEKKVLIFVAHLKKVLSWLAHLNKKCSSSTLIWIKVLTWLDHLCSCVGWTHVITVHTINLLKNPFNIHSKVFTKKRRRKVIGLVPFTLLSIQENRFIWFMIHYSFTRSLPEYFIEYIRRIICKLGSTCFKCVSASALGSRRATCTSGVEGFSPSMDNQGVFVIFGSGCSPHGWRRPPRQSIIRFKVRIRLGWSLDKVRIRSG